jgi:predicted TIM-barrel fold metal-dependent hydrolase
MDEVEDAIAEAKRCIDLGFKTLFLPVTVPWKPYWHPDYEPLWSLIEEARVPISFHVFSGNLYFGTDFAFLPFLTPEQYEASRKVNQEIGDIPERMATTVVGMAAGMGPIIHLTGSGVLERHPNLRFAIV